MIFLLLLVLVKTALGQDADQVNRWSRTSEKGLRFLARDNHAVVSFKNKIWVIGGHSSAYYTKQLVETNARSDVWSSSDGSTWENVLKEAKFEKRFGHTVTKFQPVGREEMLVLIGGFTPNPSNDIWTTTDGENWIQVEERAPFSGRAWHCAVTFNNKLWVMGGTPINNQVWWTETADSGDWHLAGNAPWSPRQGHGCVTQTRVANITLGESSRDTRLYVAGGWNGESQGDVWTMYQDGSWELLVESAPWTPRGWFSFVSFQSMTHYDIVYGERLWIMGGGTIGNGVERMHGYTDAWFSRDGVEWMEASSDETGMSTAEWCNVLVKNKVECVGKWGHTAVVFEKTVPKAFFCNDTCRTEDLTTSLAGQLIPINVESEDTPPARYTGRIQIGTKFKSVAVYPDRCGACASDSNRFYTGTKIPVLLMVAGDSAGVFKTRDVFVSDSGLYCERNGRICSNNGECTSHGGCRCFGSKDGEFCQADGLLVQMEDEASCFPSTAQVLLDSGVSIKISDIQIGDRVLSVDSNGSPTFSQVYYIPHDSNKHQIRRYLEIHYSGPVNGTLRVTPDHLVYIKDQLVAAKMIRKAQEILIFHQDKMHWAVVESLFETIDAGTHTVYTMNGRIVVDKVLCSNFGDFYSTFGGYISRDAVPYTYFASHRVLYRLFPYSSTARLLKHFNDYIMLPALALRRVIK